MFRSKTSMLVLAVQVFVLGASPYHVPPDNIIRAAGYDLDGATSEPLKWKSLASEQSYYETWYRLRNGLSISLKLDPATSQTTGLSAGLGRGSQPTSDTANLTEAWARGMLLGLNVYKVAQGEVHLGSPRITYDPEGARYEIQFPRTDGHGHVFPFNLVRFYFDHGTSCVTSLMTCFDWPEPSVTTGTMISEDQATSIAQAAVNRRKAIFFRYVPDKMVFDRTANPIEIFVEHRDNMWSPEVSRVEDTRKTIGTAVSYCVIFRSRLTDPTYTGKYDRVGVIVFVDAFSGELVGGGWSRTLIDPSM